MARTGLLARWKSGPAWRGENLCAEAPVLPLRITGNGRMSMPDGQQPTQVYTTVLQRLATCECGAAVSPGHLVWVRDDDEETVVGCWHCSEGVARGSASR